MKSFKITFFLLLLLASCNINEPIVVDNPPQIILDNQSGIYTTKVGRSIVISPNYKYANDAIYSWSINDSVVGIDSTYEFVGYEIGETYITIKVETEAGSDEEEIRVDVVELEVPFVSLPGSDNGYMLSLGEDTVFRAVVSQTSLSTHYSWVLNDEVVSDSIEYKFFADSVGMYNLMFVALNEDGADSVATTIEVVALPPVSWIFEQTEYQLVVGRTIDIGPTSTENLEGAIFTFAIGDSIVQEGEASSWICDMTVEGDYIVSISAILVRGSQIDTLKQDVALKVISTETINYRPKTETSKSQFNKVYEYTPAPGQFINELKTGGFDGSQTTPEAAVAYAESRLRADNWVSLGGFGGYIVVGFDHSIDNTGGYDFAIKGNSFDGSSEPGIVWVMQDENGDGQPNDNWYELRGSDYDNDSTIHDYAVTYYRPSAPKMPVQWTDSEGRSGQIDYLKAFHTQDYYYPLWIESDSYTLRGTCLPARNYDKSGNGSYWVQPAYDWGYADNFSPSDRIDDANPQANYFKISNAVDVNGNSLNLKYIDFVKVQVGVNTKSGWLGENSTEVTGFFDCNISQ